MVCTYVYMYVSISIHLYDPGMIQRCSSEFQDLDIELLYHIKQRYPAIELSYHKKRATELL